ncbi:neuronal acetylcholine receptor subunit alpha-10-like [Saccostrea echinata]|uniref:neuronal acetylcholine receptor subunit alpha-10-like n=2 Tax=Saccostrea echinata TaxID=191078 RepID=UPI002A80A481|nr:neuronal acetylcholine receptor subunit alpha-10-like [Saccostrea echinata]
MEVKKACSVLFFCQLCVPVGLSYLLDDLVTSVFQTYKKEVRPYCDDTQNKSVVVTIDLGVRQLVDLNEPKQTIDVTAWMRVDWIDCRLRWNKSHYNGIDRLAVPQDKIWIPDLTLYDTTDVKGLPGMKDYRAIVHSDGRVQYQFPSSVRTSCAIDVYHFPFDTQECRLVFGSWIYTGAEVHIVNKSSTLDMSSYVNNTEWDVTRADATSVVTYYSDVSYPTMECILGLRRKPLFYVMNLLFPCFLVSFTAGLGFILPPEAGEKVNLEITVLLSLAVFQLVIVNMIPASGENPPLLAIYFLVSMILVGLSCLMTVLVLNIHYKNSGHVSSRVRKYVIKPLQTIACVYAQYDHDKNDNLYIERYKRKGNIFHFPHQEESKHRQYIDNESQKQQKPLIVGFEGQLLEILREIKECSASILANQEREPNSVDWSSVAVALDRVFFVIYLLFSIVVSFSIMLEAALGK